MKKMIKNITNYSLQSSVIIFFAFIFIILFILTIIL